MNYEWILNLFATYRFKDIYAREETNHLFFGNNQIELKLTKNTGAWVGLHDKITNVKLLNHGTDS